MILVITLILNILLGVNSLFINKEIYNIENYGAKGDGFTKNTYFI